MYAAGPMAEQRTEQATPRKLARARSRGVVARSPELSAAAALLAVLTLLLWQGERLLGALTALVRAGLRAAAGPLDAAAPFAQLTAPLREVLFASAPLLIAALGGAWLAGFAQVGPLLSGRAVAPDLERLAPAERLSALLSGRRLGELGFGGLKVLVVLGVAFAAVAPSLRGLSALSLGGPARAHGVLASALAELGLRLAAALALVGLLDLAVRRVRHARDLQMSRRELADERRESDGLPEHRERRRRIYDELRAQAELGGLSRASVLLLDATGRAVALAFDPNDAGQHAPRVVAKAQGAVALRMRLWAEHDALPVRTHAALVAALYRLELAAPVPPVHYAAAVDVFASLPAASP